MPFVVSLIGYRPSPRYDEVAFTDVRFEEAPSQDGPWTAIDTQALANVDPIPPAGPPNTEHPRTRNFTTAQAALPAGWYRLVFLDSVGGEQETEPVARSGAGLDLPPDADTIRARSETLKARYPEEPLDADVERALREVVADAVALIERITGRLLDDSLPTELVRIALRATTLMTEMLSIEGSAEMVEATLGGTRLKSISAGPWSESYFATGELVVKNGIPSITGIGALDRLLWELMTDEKREEWLALATGMPAPAGAVSQFDYRRSGGHLRRWP